MQDAFRAGKLPLVVAEKVADFDAKTQKSVAGRIRSGEDPKAVLAEHLPRSDGRHQKVGNAVANFMRGLERGLADLDGRLEKVGPAHVTGHSATLREAQRVIEGLLRKAEEETKTVVEMFADCFPTDEE